MCENDKSGIYSLAGFAYQIKVFVLQLPQLKAGAVLEYETFDDVALKSTSDRLDEYEEECYGLLTANEKKAYQVKRTQVTSSTAKKIIKNWFLADKINGGISAFELVTDRKIDKEVFNKIEVTEVITEIMTTTEKKSIDAKIKALNCSEEELEDKIRYIISHATISEYENIEEMIEKRFSPEFFSTAVMRVSYIQRLSQLMQQITTEIMDSVSKGQAYEITYDKYLSIKNRIITEITDEKWEPSFAEFKKLNKLNISDLAKIKSREYLQLRECVSLDNKDIVRYLQSSEYYVNSKRLYYERGMRTLVENLEYTAYDNFCTTRVELRLANEDIPDKRLLRTTDKENSHATDNQIRCGVCINLTSADTDPELQISWKDEEDEQS